jgi:hypothetical protein
MTLQTPLSLYLVPRVDLRAYCQQDAGFQPGFRKTWWVDTRKHRQGYIDRVTVIQVNEG